MIKPINAKFKDFKYTVFDTETIQNSVILEKKTKKKEKVKLTKHDFYMIGYTLLNGKIICTKDADTFINFLERNKIKYIFAHNLAFDFRIIFPFLKDKIEIEKIIPSNIFYVRTKWKKTNYISHWISTTNFFRFSLAKLGAIFGIEKKEFDYRKIGISQYDDKLKNYLKRDVEILYRIVKELIEFHKMFDIPFTITLSQMSFRIFKKRFLKFNINNDRETNIIHLERKAYYGGRVEIIRIKGKDIIGFDFNSLYPFVMRNNEYPIQLLGKTTIQDENDLKNYLKKYFLIAPNVYLRNVYDFIPLFPKKYNGKLIFPNGNFYTSLSQVELENAFGYLTYPFPVLYYRKIDHLFTEFVDYFYKKKIESEKNNDMVHRLFFKTVMNSLYGKFAQLSPSFNLLDEKIDLIKDDIFYGDLIDLDSNEKKIILKINDKFFVLEKNIIPSFNFLPIAIHTTALARFHLWKHMVLVQDYLFYVDTDSLYINKDGIIFLESMIGKELGKLKIERKFKEANFILPKTYIGILPSGKKYTKRKGIPKCAIEKNGEFEYNHFLGIKEQLRFYSLFNSVLMQSIAKRIQSIYDKRSRNGNITFPLFFSE